MRFSYITPKISFLFGWILKGLLRESILMNRDAANKRKVFI
ncbi:hypothetical protein SAMN00777080_0433 [Aquiflexum balticum DSM 16537]|uniref:Uncharacterized protein n=1 Tax=Aquiflexum balticum DSM 16537 TaxID=758820 RepID=A0A1W2GZ48_9BACT|nr:hypothetical protein SAMN00777080_0433 [Aquiflexum balticum DSM 16537]